jgi:hypothetical protein
MAEVIKRVQTKDGTLVYYSDGNMKLYTNGNPSGKEVDESGKLKPNGVYYIGGGIHGENTMGKPYNMSEAQKGVQAVPGKNYNTIKSANDVLGWVGDVLTPNWMSSYEKKKTTQSREQAKRVRAEQIYDKYSPQRGTVPDKLVVENSQGKKVTISKAKVMNYVTANTSDGYRALSANDLDFYMGVAKMMVLRDEGWIDPVIMQREVATAVTHYATAVSKTGALRQGSVGDAESYGKLKAYKLNAVTRDIQNYVKYLNKANKNAHDLSEIKRIKGLWVGDRNKNLQRLQAHYGQAAVDNVVKHSPVKAERVGWKGGYDSSIDINYDYNPKQRTSNTNSATRVAGQQSEINNIVSAPKEYTSSDNPVQSSQQPEFANYTVNDYQNEVFDRLYGDKVDAFQQKQNQNLGNRDMQSIVGNMSPDDLRTELWSQGIFHGDVVNRDNLDSVTPQYLNGEAQANLDRRAYNNNQIDPLANQDNTGILRDAVSNFIPQEAIQNMLGAIGHENELARIAGTAGNVSATPYEYSSPMSQDIIGMYEGQVGADNNNSMVNPMASALAESLNNMGNRFAAANEQAQLNAIAYAQSQANGYYNHVDPLAQSANDRLEQLQMSTFDQAADLERKNQQLYNINNEEFNNAIKDVSDRKQLYEMYKQFKERNNGKIPTLIK